MHVFLRPTLAGGRQQAAGFEASRCVRVSEYAAASSTRETVGYHSLFGCEDAAVLPTLPPSQVLLGGVVEVLVLNGN